MHSYLITCAPSFSVLTGWLSCDVNGLGQKLCKVDVDNMDISSQKCYTRFGELLVMTTEHTPCPKLDLADEKEQGSAS